MFLGEIIKKYRDEHDMSMDEFAKKAGLSKGYISMLEKNEHPRNKKEIIPSIATFQSVAIAINIPFDELINMVNRNQKVTVNPWADEYSLISSNAIRINVYASVHAGFPQEAEDNIVDWEEIPKAWTKGGKEYIGIRVKGDCMAPKYLEGDTVIVKLQNDCESGQDAVVYVNGYESQLRKFIRKDDKIILQPLNSDYLPDTYYINDPDNPVVVVGVVAELRRKFI